MRIAFYGIARHVGTSANMAAVKAYVMQNLYLSAYEQNSKAALCQKTEEIVIKDRSRENLKDVIRVCDLLALNLSIPDQELEENYLSYSFVRRNVIFLIGKYYQNQRQELELLIRQYRIDPSRVCTIPYNPRFANAYENRNVSAYLKSIRKNVRSYEDLDFEKHLQCAVRTIITFGKRKGE